jgi:glycerophosphoryl diester phosphodiesterase
MFSSSSTQALGVLKKTSGTSKIGHSDGRLLSSVLVEMTEKRKATALDRLLVVAHRGFEKVAVQNTMHAFTTSLSRGAAAVEFDLQVTSDGQLVCFHDSLINNIFNTNDAVPVSSKTLSELRELTFRDYGGTRYEGERIPLLSEVLRWASRNNVFLFPELKSYVDLSTDVGNLLSEIQAAGMGSRVAIQGDHATVLTEVRSINKSIAISWVTDEYSASVMDGLIALGDGPVWCLVDKEEILANYETIFPHAQEAGINLGAFVVNEKADLDAIMSLGVNVILSDNAIG